MEFEGRFLTCGKVFLFGVKVIDRREFKERAKAVKRADKHSRILLIAMRRVKTYGMVYDQVDKRCEFFQYFKRNAFCFFLTN